MDSRECTRLHERQISLRDCRSLGRHHRQLHLALGIEGATSNTLYYSGNILEEVGQWTPTVVMIELRRFDIYAIKVRSETSFDLKNDIMLLLTKIIGGKKTYREDD
jgi:hypothetical protein